MPTRTRNRHVSVWLTDAELAHLRKQAAAAGLGIDPFLRSLILGVQLRPRPPDTYAALLRELSAIGNNINQIAHTVNGQKYAADSQIDQAVALVRRAWRLVKGSF
ncbi:MAG: plasmid mobilization relaxosome protein MobC [Clostridiales bacterium]|nr:plasmid mobilization relaxosome protein MobC [Clostridiales bacterium]